MRLATRAATSGAVVFAVVSALIIRQSIPWVTTYAAASTAAMLAQLAAGGALIAAGAIWTLERPTDRLGVLAPLTGMAWFAPAWVGWQGGPGSVRTVAMLVEPALLPLACDLVASICGARVRLRTALGMLYVLAGGLGATRLLVTDPLVDPNCWNNCTANVLLISSQPWLARLLFGAWVAVSIVAGVVLAFGAARHLATASPTARRLRWPVLLPASLLGCSIAAHGIAVVAYPPENPADPRFMAIFQVQAWSLAALAVGVANGVFRARRSKRAAANLAVHLGAVPELGTLGRVLARATADPSLDVLYWLPESARFVDGSGRAADAPVSGTTRAVAQILRQGELIAAISHDPAVVDPGGLVQAIGPAARLAIDNERLQAELLAQLEDLRTSQVRIVQAGDSERRRLERNLHDAAQQAVLALSYDIRVASAAARRSGHPELPDLLDQATAEVQEAIEDLRLLAHGIYPAVLTESGLGPALNALADTTPIRVEVGKVTATRGPRLVERTAYLAAADVIDEAARLGRDELAVGAVRMRGQLVVEIHGADLVPTTALADRVGALGGRIIERPAVLRVEIPCE